MAALDPTMVLADSNLATALYGEAGQLASEQGQANAFNIEAQGAAAEAGQYDLAGQISTNNAQTELVSGQLQQFQNTRKLLMTLGSQTAGYAGSGFQASGSTLSVARSSLQQGLLQNQVLGVNANLAAGGYLEQAAASQAEATTARTAAAAANANATTANSLSAITKANMSVTSNFIGQLPAAQANSILYPGSPGTPGGGPAPGAPLATVSNTSLSAVSATPSTALSNWQPGQPAPPPGTPGGGPLGPPLMTNI